MTRFFSRIATYGRRPHQPGEQRGAAGERFHPVRGGGSCSGIGSRAVHLQAAPIWRTSPRHHVQLTTKHHKGAKRTRGGTRRPKGTKRSRPPKGTISQGDEAQQASQGDDPRGGPDPPGAQGDEPHHLQGDPAGGQAPHRTTSNLIVRAGVASTKSTTNPTPL